MSRIVQIDYQAISIKCQSICEIATNQLYKLEETLDIIEKGSTKLLNFQTEELKKEIIKNKQDLQNKISLLISKAKKNESFGKVYIDSDDISENIIKEAEELKKATENLIDIKVFEMEALLNQLMSERLFSKKLNFDNKIQKEIDNIEDEIMKQYVYVAWLDNPEYSFEELCTIAKEIKIKTEEGHYNLVENKKIEEIRQELKKQKIEEATIEKIINNQEGTVKERLQKIREDANKEIIDEKIRHESVKIIVKAIKKRGFIVSNDAIKIDRKNNQVNILAQKPSGAKAEFKIYLDGKFVYKFDGYEGQACQNDIKPFMDDLEEIYGIKVIKESEIWSNPDKNSTMKYQTVNYNKNKG